MSDQSKYQLYVGLSTGHLWGSNAAEYSVFVEQLRNKMNRILGVFLMRDLFTSIHRLQTKMNKDEEINVN